MTEILTPRLRLRHWRIDHRNAFAGMHADPEVMADLGGPIGRAEAEAKFNRYVDAFLNHGTSRWAVEDVNGALLGYAGVMARPDTDHPLGPHHEIGWRFIKAAWGHGYATESAQAALEFAVHTTGLNKIIAYTGPDNHRSQAVMKRLELRRRADMDFLLALGGGKAFSALVWDLEPRRYLQPRLI